MTEIEKVKEEIKVLEKKLALLEELEKTKTPVEEAYKDWMGEYPPTGPSVDGIDDIRWRAFQMGYNAAYEEKVSEWEPTPQTPEQVADGLKEAFREAVKQGVVSSVDKPKTLTDLIYRWWSDVFTTHSDWDMETSVEDLVDQIQMWLPKEQSAAGSQNVYVECAVDGYNDCLNEIKSKLK
jgi:hypothetical protein